MDVAEDREENEGESNINDIKQYLDELENMCKDCEGFEGIKSKIAEVVSTLKEKLDEERLRRKREEEKVVYLEKCLDVEKSALERVKKKNERMVDKVNYMKRKQKSCEMENKELLENMEVIKGRIAKKGQGQTVQEQKMSKEVAGLQTRLQCYKQEMVRSRTVIQFGTRGIDILQRNLELSIKEIHNQREENEEIKQELLKYKKNHTDRIRIDEFMMQDLRNLERFLQPQHKAICCRKSGKNTLELNIIRRMREQLTEASCFLVN